MRRNARQATGEVYGQLVEEESARTVMVALREVIERKGVFCALYSSRTSDFFHTPRAGGKIDPHQLTQVGRAVRRTGAPSNNGGSRDVRGLGEANSRGEWI